MLRHDPSIVEPSEFAGEVDAWRAVAALASTLSSRVAREAVEALDALAAAKLRELQRAAAEATPTHYTQLRSPLGADAGASRRFRKFVRAHGLPHTIVGSLIVVRRELFDAKLAELESVPRRRPRGCAARLRSNADAD